MVGVGTVIADNPLLTDRSGLSTAPSSVACDCGFAARMPLDSRIVKTANNDVIVLCSFAEEKKKQQLLDCGIRVEQIEQMTADGRPDMASYIAPSWQT